MCAPLNDFATSRRLSIADPLWRGEIYRRKDSRGLCVRGLPRPCYGCLDGWRVRAEHDRNRFELIALSFGPDDKSEMRARVKDAFDRFIDVRERSDAEIAALMRQMEIDIAVDLKGYTKDHRSGIFALRPAPLQPSYLGYPGTMGAPYFDYHRGPHRDSRRAPPYYTEKIAYLPDTYQCNDSRRGIADRGFTRGGQELQKRSFVFCCFNNSYKIAPGDFSPLWMRLLREFREAMLWLLEDNPMPCTILSVRPKHAASRNRLVFAPRLSPAEHLARHRLADLFLDTLPYGAHTTASDALWPDCVPQPPRSHVRFARGGEFTARDRLAGDDCGFTRGL